jgi:hypothetical protein
MDDRSVQVSLELKFENRCADADRAAKFHGVTNAAAAALAGVAERAGTPPVRVTVVFTDNFVDSVDEFLAAAAARLGHQPQPYTTDRVGGQAAAKNITLADDASEIAVVINADLHQFAVPDHEAHSLFIATHELTHPLLTRLRVASGANGRIPPPATAAADVARGIVAGAVDEYRCDRVADAVLGALATMTVNGETRPLRVSDLYAGIGHFDGLRELMDTHVHPAWPDLVQSYREGRIGLEEMWQRLIIASDQTLTALAHAEAEAAAAEVPGPADGACADHPGMRLYLTPAWSAIMTAAEAHPLVPALDQFAGVDHAIVETGKAAVLGLWSRLGVTATLDPSGRDYLHVGAPTR